MRARTSEEKTIDRLLTLYCINECAERFGVSHLSETKLQKLVFLSEKELIDRRIKAFNYRFIRLLHPTFSPDLRDDLTDFVRFRFLREPWLERTDKMRMILEDFHDVLTENRHSLQVIDEVLSRYSSLRTERLINLVYQMPWSRNKTINDLAMRTPLLYPLKPDKAQETFRISEDELENLEICLNPKISAMFDQAVDDMRKGRLLSHAEVFGKL